MSCTSNCYSYPWQGKEIAVKNALSAAEKARLHREQRSPFEYNAGECSATQVGRCIYKCSITDLQILSSPMTYYSFFVRVGFFAGYGFVVAAGFFVGFLWFFFFFVVLFLLLVWGFCFLAWLIGWLVIFPGLPYMCCGNV